MRASRRIDAAIARRAGRSYDAGVMARRLRLDGVLFVLVAAFAAHVAFNGIGFCPTDEGYMLSGSRRILDGQIPFRDYISLRPVGTHLLHAPFLLLLRTGDRLIWWSRFFPLLEIAAASWLWTLIADWRLGVFSRAGRFVVAAFGFIASVGNFPMMPWNTIDGVFFISLGIASQKVWDRRILGLFLIGCSPLFRQNFLLPLPILVALLGEAFSPGAWIAALSPSALGALAAALFGALPDALLQMGSHGGSLAPVLAAPFTTFALPVVQGALTGAIGFLLATRSRDSLRLAGLALLGAGFAYSGLTIPISLDNASTGWFLFAALAAGLPWLSPMIPMRPLLLALAAAWGASISEGCPQPQLITSALSAAYAALLLKVAPPRLRLAHALLAVALAIGLYGFQRGRRFAVNGDLNADRLTCDVGGALPGGRGVFTNPNTFGFLKDLVRTTDALRAQGRRYAVVPEATQFWVTSPQPNPLSSDWPIDPELADARLSRRVLDELDALHGKAVIVVQKYWTIHLPGGDRPIAPGECKVVDKVRKDFRRVGETEYLELYE